MNYFCVAGCGNIAVHEHHIIYVQELRRVAKSRQRDTKPSWFSELVRDRRNLVAVCLDCHTAHHARTRPLEFRMLPNTVFGFARDVLGVGPAHEYFIRRYVGDDPRVDALLAEWEAAA